MRTATVIPLRLVICALIALLAPACSPTLPPAVSPTAPAALQAATPGAPEWFSIQMVDARTKQPFAIQDFSGKVVLVETMAVWCPNCRTQEQEVEKLHALLGNSPDLVSVSLDVDLNEDINLLAKHVTEQGFDWHFAVAPLEVDRALGNLYSAEYLNPPLAPMLLIDRQGKVYGLPYGFKSADALKKTVDPYLAK